MPSDKFPAVTETCALEPMLFTVPLIASAAAYIFLPNILMPLAPSNVPPTMVSLAVSCSAAFRILKVPLAPVAPSMPFALVMFKSVLDDIVSKLNVSVAASSPVLIMVPLPLSKLMFCALMLAAVPAPLLFALEIVPTTPRFKVPGVEIEPAFVRLPPTNKFIPADE